MIQLIRAIVKNGQKYLFTKRIFTENVNYYFGAMKSLGSAKQTTHMFLEKVGKDGNTLLKRKVVEKSGNGLEKSIFRSDYVKDTYSFSMIDKSGKVIHNAES